MKSLLKKALSTTTNIRPKNKGPTKSAVDKTRSIYRNRRSGQLKRLRNERYKRINKHNKSWKEVKSDPNNSRKKPRKPPADVKQEVNEQVLSKSKKIVQSRRAVFNSTSQRVFARKEKDNHPLDSILFANMDFHEIDAQIKDIICS